MDNKVYATDKEKAEALNKQFTPVFTKSNNTSDLPDKGPSPYPAIDDLHISTSGVIKQLKKLQTNKASGPDEIPARMLQDYAEELAPMITHIFQQSYTSGQLPKDLLAFTRKARNQSQPTTDLSRLPA